MGTYRRVVWNEGMLLSPQHFQQASHHQDQETRFRTTSLIAYAWGLRSIQVDEEALANGRFLLKKLEAILPNGTYVRAPEVDPLPAGPDLAEHLEADQTTLAVYLTLPEARPGISVCRLPGSESSQETTYLAEMTNIADENQPDRRVDMLVARQNLSIRTSRQDRDGRVSLKIAEVIKNLDGSFALSRDYAPPSISATCAGPIPAILHSILQKLAGRSEELAGRTRESGARARDFSGVGSATYGMLHTINSFIPLLADYERMVRRGDSLHPIVVYRSLVQLAGALCTFSLGLDPRSVPPYEHDELGPTFRGLEKMIRDGLDVAEEKRYRVVDLERISDALHWAQLSDPNLLQAGQEWYLCVHGEVPEREVADQFPQQAIIAAKHNIQTAINMADLGVRMSHTSVPPKEFPFRAGHTYFRLEIPGDPRDWWEAVCESQTIALYLPPKFQPLNYEFLILTK